MVGLTAEEELHWLALRMVPGLGTRKAGLLLDQLRTPQAIFRASRSELEGLGLSGTVAQSIASGCSFEDAASQQEEMRRCGATLITRGDERWPARLQDIYDAPFALFARGRLDLLQSWQIAVVGTRRPTPYGIAATERLAADLAQAGLTITSGMARGIDTAAHRAVLQNQGATIAVLGCGVDVVYPQENKSLAAQIIDQGLMLSEFPLGTPAYPQNFPIRNRIVSGLSTGVLVVEGAQYSGSAITAKLALDQGREVFAVPGSIMSKMSWGPNLLIKQGAKLVQEWTDVVTELPPEVRRNLSEQARQRLLPEQLPLADAPFAAANASDKDNPLHRTGQALLRCLRPDQPTQLDALMERMEGVSSSELIAALFELELLGSVRQLPGKNFVTVW